MMVPQIFKPSDLSTINAWLSGHGMRPIDLAALPRFGLIIPEAAAGFLYETDSHFAIIDGYVTSPASPRAERDHALNLITASLLKHAKARGFKLVKCDTQIQAIERRAIRHGFLPLGVFKSFAKEL